MTFKSKNKKCHLTVNSDIKEFGKYMAEHDPKNLPMYAVTIDEHAVVIRKDGNVEEFPDMFKVQYHMIMEGRGNEFDMNSLDADNKNLGKLFYGLR